MSAKSDANTPFTAYLKELHRNLASGIAAENTHRHALQNLLEALNPKILAFNDPQHISVGAPDFTIRRKGRAHDFSVGWIETKDVGEDLNKVEKSEQLKRYFGLPNLILTDYLEFRWYTDGERRLTARLATAGKKGKLTPEPNGEKDVRELLTAFLDHQIPEITSPSDLAERMADLAHLIRDLILRSFEGEATAGKLHKEFEAFRQTLIPDLKPEQFADMYAQTIAYGLFAARCQPVTSGERFSRERAAHLIPKTNPFLRRLFNEIAGPNLDEKITPFVDDLVALLRDADMHSILADFGRRSGKEDPVVHFYEDFLQEYDPKMRELRGVYYTPEPVVSYIVRSVDHLLKTKFNKPLGLADKDVLILDPACGTGTFLYYVIRHIYLTLLQQGQKGKWNTYVSENLLKRIFGFELLMAPYAMAHLKLGLLLQELGYEFDSDERLGIYLTNTLEEAIKKSELIFAQYIADEANAASEIKRDKPIMVVLGNPPYSGHSANKGKWIAELVADYKRDCPELYKPAQAKWLQDDYVKFLRFGHWRIQRTGYGILAFITNHAYLDNPTFRCMRQKLLTTFNGIHILDLHGNSKKKEKSPDGSKDENVFDIQQGVAIGLYVKDSNEEQSADYSHAEHWGHREKKYTILSQTDITSTKWSPIEPIYPLHLFKPQNLELLAEYGTGWKISEAMSQNGDPAPGIVTTHDEFAISWSAQEARNKVHALLGTNSEQEARGLFRLCKQSQWDYDKAKRELSTGKWKDKVTQLLYRPFDLRYTVFDSNVAVHRRERVMRHMLDELNVAFVLPRRVEMIGSWQHVFISRMLVDHVAVSLKTVDYTIPLFLKGDSPTPGQRQRSLLEVGDMATLQGWKPNLSPDFISELERRLGLSFNPDKLNDAQSGFGPSDVFNYIYAVLHSPTYRKRYAAFLREDFPRIPLTSDHDLFVAVVAKGGELVSLHLMDSPSLSKFITRYEQHGDHLVEKVRYVEPNPAAKIKFSRVYINAKQFFEGVPKEVWEFHIGGYQVCEKWLKDRKGCHLSADDIDHYQKIVVALKETIRLMAEIDALIPSWPLP